MTKLYKHSDTKPTLCIVVCVHNATEYAEICLESVIKHTPEPYELIIVNDGSRADTTSMLKRFAHDYEHVRILYHTHAQGYTRAANAGLYASKADYTILLNSDTIVSPLWSERIIACGESDKNIGIVGPLSNAATYQSVPFVFEDDGTWKQNILPGDVSVTAYAEAVGRVSLKSYPRVPVANGFCFAVKRELINCIGYLDEETFPRGYGEENDYCLRAADAGFEIAIADDVYVYHATSKSFGIKAREQLTRDAHQAIRSKYSQERLDGIDAALRGHDAMKKVRERIIANVVHQPTLADAGAKHLPFGNAYDGLSFLFVAPDCTATSGGTQVIIETARGLAQMGIPVKVAAKKNIRTEYENFFPADAHLFFYYQKDKELIEHAAGYRVAIATIFHSIRQVQQIVKKHPHIMPAYYVQDYEPWFLDEYPNIRELAEESYSMIEGNVLFAISPWVQDVVYDKHGQKVQKIWGSLDQSLFYPDYGRTHDKPISVAAMVRPSTPWRGPKQTMRTLKHLKDTFGDEVSIRIFGCHDHELATHQLEIDFEYENYGVLGRLGVASLLRATDVFLDLSEFQAFGRTALEAMACGCAVIAPEKGGVRDFGRHGDNVLLVNTSDDDACQQAAQALARDTQLRTRLRTRGIATGFDYSIHRSVMSFLDLMSRMLAQHEQQTAEHKKVA